MLLAVVIFAVVPFGLGWLGFDLVRLMTYTMIAALTLTGIAWSRESDRRRLRRDEMILAVVIRALLAFLLGGVFMILGMLSV